MAWRDSRRSSLPARWKRKQASGATIRATPRDVFRLPCDAYRWVSAETNEEPTCGRSANRACQLASSWSRDDHEDGGPTIQLPAAEARCTLRSLSCVQYIRGKVELIFANFGLDLTVALEPVIDEGSLSAVVIMVIVTTMAISPRTFRPGPRLHG